MELKILCTSAPNVITKKEDFDIFSGHTAGICYMAGDFDEIENEDTEKTQKRIELTKSNGHHSVYDHLSISLYLKDIPIALAMILNNEKMYTTSQKSGRYTMNSVDSKTEQLYYKWLAILKNKIAEKYSIDYPYIFTDKKITKLAQENARYVISVFSKTSMVYTVSYRQLNYLFYMLKMFLKDDIPNRIAQGVKPYIEDFLRKIESTGYIDSKITNAEKQRKISLFNEYDSQEYFGDVYCTSYMASLPELAQAQRHRTISYYMRETENIEYYVPRILEDNEELVNLWLEDLKNVEDTVPQATMVKITEMGTLDNFILKLFERKCFCAQLEINEQTNRTLKQYQKALTDKMHPRATELKSYTNGSRCTFPNYKCSSPCGFSMGVNETRLI